MSFIWISTLFISLLASFLKSPFLNDNSINSITCNFTQWEPISVSLLTLVIAGCFPEQPCGFRSYFLLQAPEGDRRWEMDTVLTWGWDVLLFPIPPHDSPVGHTGAASLCPLSHRFSLLRSHQVHQLRFRCFVKCWDSAPPPPRPHVVSQVLESRQGKWRWNERVHFGFDFQGSVKW